MCKGRDTARTAHRSGPLSCISGLLYRIGVRMADGTIQYVSRMHECICRLYCRLYCRYTRTRTRLFTKCPSLLPERRSTLVFVSHYQQRLTAFDSLPHPSSLLFSLACLARSPGNMNTVSCAHVLLSGDHVSFASSCNGSFDRYPSKGNLRNSIRFTFIK